MVSEFRVELNTLVGGKRFDVLVCHTKLGVRTLNLDSCESIFRDAAPLLREHVIEEVSDRALAGTVLADENKSVVVNRNVYCPVPSVKALDLKLGQRRWHMEYWNANDITYLESAVSFAAILDLCGRGQGPDPLCKIPNFPRGLWLPCDERGAGLLLRNALGSGDPNSTWPHRRHGRTCAADGPETAIWEA